MTYGILRPAAMAFLSTWVVPGSLVMSITGSGAVWSAQWVLPHLSRASSWMASRGWSFWITDSGVENKRVRVMSECCCGGGGI